jgi:pimeloyl-ACP methyl ester carboxylesterase
MISLPVLPVLLLGLSAGTSAAASLPSRQRCSRQVSYNTSNSISWGPCPTEMTDLANYTCGTLEVPLDWDHPDSSETITLGMVRVAANDQDDKIGSLFINPGGPGAPASAMVYNYTLAVIPEVLDRFDTIALDPRGVGFSTPLQCDVDLWNERVTYSPQTEDEFDKLVEHNRAVSNSCREMSGRLIDFVDTVSAAKDFEAVRIALGGDKATFLGLSYGSMLFNQYAELFPDGIRAMVLDAITLHSQDEAQNLLTESTSYEATLTRFFDWCKSDTSCPLAGQDVDTIYLDILAQAKQTPIPAASCDDGASGCRSTVTEEDIRFAVQDFLILEPSWPILGEALDVARNGDASLISEQLTLAINNTYVDSIQFAGIAIACQDWTHKASTFTDVQQKQLLGATFSPFTRGAAQTYKIQTACIGWSAPLTNPEHRTEYKGNTTIMLVGSTRDPSDGYTWALGLHAEIENSVLFTRNGSGHTSYALGGETTAAENAYLLNLTLPEAGMVVSS